MNFHSVLAAWAASAGAALTVAALAFPAHADDAAARPIRIVVPFAAGGSTDALARIVGRKLGESLKQPIVVDNRPGAAGAIGADAVAKAPPDGLTLLLATTSTHAVLPRLRTLPYDAERDFTPVAVIATAPNVLVASPALKVANVSELLAHDKARAGRLAYSSSGLGTITHLIGAAFAQRAGVAANHIPYKTGVQALTDISSGQVDFAFDSIVWTLPQDKAGKVRALAIAAAKRSPLAPELPTVAESGFPGFEGTTWFAFVAPARLPAATQALLNQHVNAALRDPEVRAQFQAQGAEPVGGTPDELTKLMRDDAKRWGAVIAAGNIKLAD